MRCCPSEIEVEGSIMNAGKLKSHCKIRKYGFYPGFHVNYIPATLFRDHPENPSGYDPDKDRSLDFEMSENKDQDKTNDREHERSRANLSKPDKYGTLSRTYHYARVIQTDKGYEQPDTCCYACLQRLRYTVQQRLSGLEDRKKDEDDTFNKNCRKSDCERVFHISKISHTDCISKISG